MSDLKYTSGPWKVMYTTSDDGECFLSVVPANTEEGETVTPICKISPMRSENETDKANASLIAAVPDMENALRSFVVGMNNQDEQFPGHNQAYLTQVVLPRAIQALEKAGIK